MKTIIFCRKGEAVSDFEISNYVDEIFNSRKRIWRISSVLVIDEIRARVKENKLKLGSFQIIVEDLSGALSTFTLDKNGKSAHWRDSMEIRMNLAVRLL